MRRVHAARPIARVATILVLSVLATTPVHGQDGATFLTLGPVGLGLSEGQAGAAVHAALGHAFGRSVVSGRAAALLVGADFLWDDLWDVALVYGRAFRDGDTFFSVGAGVGYVGGSVFGQDRHTAGLALEAQAFNNPSSRVAVGFYVFANLNGHRSFGGATLAVRFGRQ